MSVQRRLAAILSADVAGYSRLMGADEVGTLAALNDHRAACIDPAIAARGGRIVKLMGDGMLVEFASAVDAVECAVAVQRGMAGRNADVPEDQRIEFRIGINLGDIIVEGDDIHGDGVNVAARIQEIAAPGGVALSDFAHHQVAGKVEATFADGGEHSLKNIAKPVRIYRWAEGAVAAASEAPLALPDKPSIAVLPFTNMSGDAEQEYFSDGISEDIITELSRFRSLFVIARNSSFAFKGQSVNVGKIGRELGVAYVVEGSVRKAGNRVRITAQLVEAASGNHLWAERYDRDLDDIFAVQDEVTLAIVTAIEPTLGSAERERARRKPTGNLDAWENYQRGLWNMYQFTAQENAEAQSFFRRAIEFDANFAPAHAGLAHAIYISVFLGFRTNRAPDFGEARDAAERALTLDGDDALAHLVLGRLHMVRGEHEAAVSACETARALNPNLAIARYGLGTALACRGDYEEAIVELDEAIRLSPRDPMLWWILAIKSAANLSTGRYEAGLEFARASLRQPNAGVWAYVHEIATLAHLDRIEEARQSLARARAIMPDFDLNFVASRLQQMRWVGREHFIEGLKKAGLEE